MKKLSIFLFLCAVAQTQQITTNNVQSTAKQGNGTKFQLAGTVSGSGIPLCTDANGNTTTSLCPGTVAVPLPVNAGGTGVNTLTMNGVIFGNGSGNVNGTIAGTQYQILTVGPTGVPYFGQVNLAQAVAVTGVLPKTNYTMPAWADITGSKQGNTNVPQMAGVNSGVPGVNLCNDANGNSTTSGCIPGFVLPTANNQLQYLRTQPNSGNLTSYQFSTITPLNTNDYMWTLTPGGSLTGGIQATVTFAVCPLGLAGTHTIAGGLPQLVYISNGTVGAAEAINIIGGTCIGNGINGGTIIFTPSNSHGGSWTIQSASDGASECIYIAGSGGSCKFPSGTVNLYGTLTIPDGWFFSLRGQGQSVTNIVTSFTTGNGIYAAGLVTGGALDLGDFSIYGSGYFSSGNMIFVQNRGYGSVSNIYAGKCWNCFNIEYLAHMQIHDLWAQTFAHYGMWINCANSIGSCLQTGVIRAVRLSTVNNNVVGLQVDGNVVGIIFDHFFIEQGIVPTANDYGVFLNYQAASTPNVQFLNSLVDGWNIGILITGSASACKPNSDTRIQGNHIGSIEGVYIQGAYACNIFIDGNTVAASQGGLAQIPAVSDRGIIVFSGASNIFVTNNVIDTDGDSAVFINGANHLLFSGNRIGALQINGGINPTYDFSLLGTITDLRIIGNPVLINSLGVTGIIANGATLTNFTASANPDLDMPVSIANGAALALPFNSSFTLTSGTAVTSATYVGISGARWSFTVTVSTTFTAGASIGNTITIAKYATAFWDGTKLWINGI